MASNPKNPKVNSVVVFDKTKVGNLGAKTYNKYYKRYEGLFFVFLGEIVQAPGHCMLLNMKTGKIEAMRHTKEFRQLKDGEF